MFFCYGSVDDFQVFYPISKKLYNTLLHNKVLGKIGFSGIGTTFLKERQSHLSNTEGNE